MGPYAQVAVAPLDEGDLLAPRGYKVPVLKFLAAGFLLAAKPPDLVAGGHHLSSRQVERVDRGEVLVQIADTNDDTKMLTAIGRVEHSAGDVYRLMTDFQNYPRIYNSIASAKVEHQSHRVVGISFHVRAPWPLPERTVVSKTWLDPEHFSFTWRRQAGTIRIYEGELHALPGRAHSCYVFYSARIDPGYDWLPAWFVTWGQTHVLPSLIRGIRDTLGKRQGPYWEPGVEHPAFDWEPS